VQQNNAAANKMGTIFFILLRVTNRVYDVFYYFVLAVVLSASARYALKGIPAEKNQK